MWNCPHVKDTTSHVCVVAKQDGTKDEREVDNSDDAASANQKRMNADPLEVRRCLWDTTVDRAQNMTTLRLLAGIVVDSKNV